MVVFAQNEMLLSNKKEQNNACNDMEHLTSCYENINLHYTSNYGKGPTHSGRKKLHVEVRQEDMKGQ